MCSYTGKCYIRTIFRQYKQNILCDYPIKIIFFKAESTTHSPVCQSCGQFQIPDIEHAARRFEALFQDIFHHL